MTDTATKAPRTKPLYERDFFAWTKEQGERLRARAHNDIDWDNVAEEIESLGRRDKTEIRNQLGILVKHLLKWEYQPDRRCHSWQSTISELRLRIEATLEDSPSLKRFPEEALDRAWQWARRDASRETGLALETVPAVPSYALGDILSPDFMPGVPWSPDDLIRD